MNRLQVETGPLVVVSLVAVLATLLVITDHGGEVPLIVGAVTTPLALFVGRPKSDPRKSDREAG